MGRTRTPGLRQGVSRVRGRISARSQRRDAASSRHDMCSRARVMHCPFRFAALVLSFAAIAVGCGGQSTAGPTGSSGDAGPERQGEAGANGGPDGAPGDGRPADAPGVACCQGDDECSAGQVCAVTRCLPKPPPGACWRNIDCPIGDRCMGARICSCSADCSFDALPGACAPPADDAGMLTGCPPVPLLPAGSSCDVSQVGSDCEYPASQFGAGYCLCEKTGSGYEWQCQ